MPLNFQLSAMSSSVLMANWTPPSSPNGILTGYTVYCTVSHNQTYPEQVPTGGSTYTVFNVTSQTSVYLRGLLPFTFYHCYVTANTTVGEGGSSIARLSQTNQAGNTSVINTKNIASTQCLIFPPPPPPPPANLNTSHFPVPSSPRNFSLSPVAGSPYQLSASWSVPIPRNGIITGYSVYCNSSFNQPFPEQVIGPNVPTTRSVVNGTTLAVTFNTGLSPYTQYSCYATANTSVGEGPLSRTVAATTGEAGMMAEY